MRKLFIPLMLIVIGLIGCSGGVKNQTPLPNSIEGMQLKKVYTGNQALEMVKQLHQKPVTSQDTYVGEYEGKEYNAKMYITEYQSPDSAVATLEQMAGAMMNPHGDGASAMGFQHVRKLDKYGAHVYMALQGSRAHYFYVQGNKLYWLDIDPHVAMSAMETLVGTKAPADSTMMH